MIQTTRIALTMSHANTVNMSDGMASNAVLACEMTSAACLIFSFMQYTYTPMPRHAT